MHNSAALSAVPAPWQRTPRSKVHLKGTTGPRNFRTHFGPPKACALVLPITLANGHGAGNNRCTRTAPQRDAWRRLLRGPGLGDAIAHQGTLRLADDLHPAVSLGERCRPRR